jgi:hypothetical protein
MARCGRGCMAATKKRRADGRARRGENEADRWDPAAAIFRIKNYSQTKIAQNKFLKVEKNSRKIRGGRKSNLEHFS